MTTNISSNLTRRYKFLPIDLQVRDALQSFNGVCGLYALLANGAILYLTKKLTKRRKQHRQRKNFDRSFVTTMFIQSLAVSDLSCACLSTPFIIVLHFLAILNRDLLCKMVRGFSLFFPIVTINNLFIIGIERYLAVFHPFRVPTVRTVKYLITGAWVLGVVIATIPASTFRLVQVDVEPGIYTNTCIHDKTVTAYKIIMFAFGVVVYVVPAIILSVTSTRILLYLKKRKRQRQSERKGNASRFKGTITLVALIFTFILPYFLSYAFTVINMILNLQMTFTAQYVVRRAMVVLVNSNAAISPTVMLLTLPDLRKMLKSLVFDNLASLTTRRIYVVNDSTSQNVNNIVVTSL